MLTKLHAHRVDLFDTNTVLAGNGSTELNAGLEYVGTKLFRTVPLIWISTIKQNERMHIAVACMENIQAAQSILLFHFLNAAQEGSNVTPRNRAVHAVVVGCNAACCWKGIFTTAPKRQALRFIFRNANAAGACFFQHCSHAPNFFRHFFWRTVRLAQQNSNGV